MCELFGFDAVTPHTINDDLNIFYSHSNKHPHGWGIVTKQGNQPVFMEKEPERALDSARLHEILASPVTPTTALAHIRYATIGQVEPYNCHPFTGKDAVGRTWYFMHNGTIFEYDPISPYLKRQQGSTDSERIFLFLIDSVNAFEEELGRASTGQERFALLDSIFVPMAKGNKLNLLFTDGDYLYVHTNLKKSLHYLQTEDFLEISTRPLNDAPWQPLPLNQLLAVKNGAFVFRGTVHENEYFFDKKQYQELYSIFAEL